MKLGCLTSAIYIICFVAIIMSLPNVIESFYLIANHNKFNRNEFVVTRYLDYEGGQYPEDRGFEMLEGKIDGKLEILHVNNYALRDSTIKVWFYPNGWENSFLGFNTRVWLYDDEMKSLIKKKIITNFTIVLPFAAIWLLTYLVVRFKFSDKK
ncbi:MAG: hypothetical protein K2X86_06465 [Cytophagaceae bacterium]|nr:hypothetical protein [Cytophagaceae bacterium]